MNKLSLTIVGILAISGSAAHACTCGTGTHQVGDVCVADKTKAPKAPPTTAILAPSQGQGQTQSNGQGQSQSGINRSTNNVTSTNQATTGASTSSASGGKGGNATGGEASIASVAGGAGGSAAGGSAQGGTGTGGSSTADGGNASNGSQSQAYTEVNPRSPVMTAFAMASNTTAECRYGDALGFQTFGVGFSGSKSRADKDCRLKVMADLEYSRGNNAAGDKLTCKISYVHDALGSDCEGLLNEQPKYAPRQYTEAEVTTLLNKQSAVLRSGK